MSFRVNCLRSSSAVQGLKDYDNRDGKTPTSWCEIRETKSSGVYKGECIIVETDLFPEFTQDILVLESSAN